MATPDLEALLARMTWTDKLAQLQILWRRNQDDALALARGGIGALFWPQSAEHTNALQRAAVEESTHGIPVLIGLDVIHGAFTIFPTPLAQAASFDPAVAETDARVSAAEARSGGVNWTFSPMVDVTRDPRWGRVVEGFGEDSFLASAFGAAKVRGYQGADLTSRDTLAACLKHFVAYGAAEAGRDYNTTDVSSRRLRATYLEPFRSGVAAGAASVMAAFNSLNGTPMHAHKRLLTDVLTTEYGFEGVVVGDADGVSQLVAHGVARDEGDAVRQSLSAGLDVVMGGSHLVVDGVPLIEPGGVEAARVDAAVMRILRLKARLGLFNNPYSDPASELSSPTSETLDAAQHAAERCVVLVKNDGDLLPLTSARKVLLTGPYADSVDHLGAWVQHFAAGAGTVSDALRTELPHIVWTVAPGADFLAPSDAEIRESAALAAQHDLVIIAVGEPSSISGEASSRADIRLPGDQERLIHAIADTGASFIVVLATGRPLVVEDWIDRAPAVLLTWHLGSRAPEAIARVLSGAVNPGGRLPMTFPRAVGQIPTYHDAENTGRPARTGGSMAVDRWDVGLQGPNNTDDDYTSKFLDLARGPRFAFGHGLSYTTFELTGISASRSEVSVDELHNGSLVRVSATLRNVGDRDGDDVVFAYLSDPVASVAQPTQRLRGFSRMAVAAGAAVTVSFDLGEDELGFWTDDDKFLVEPGELLIALTDGTDRLQHHLTVTP